MNKKVLATISALLVCFALLYRDVIAKLVHDWYVDDNYSHGFLIVPIALYFVWERRGKLREAVARPSPRGPRPGPGEHGDAPGRHPRLELFLPGSP